MICSFLNVSLDSCGKLLISYFYYKACEYSVLLCQMIFKHYLNLFCCNLVYLWRMISVYFAEVQCLNSFLTEATERWNATDRNHWENRNNILYVQHFVLSVPPFILIPNSFIAYTEYFTTISTADYCCKCKALNEFVIIKSTVRMLIFYF